MSAVTSKFRPLLGTLVAASRHDIVYFGACEKGGGVHDDLRVESLSEAIVLARSAAREEQAKLQAVLGAARGASASLLTEQRRLRDEGATAADEIARLEAELSGRRSSELAHRVVSLRERRQALQQQEERVGERIARYVALCQRLRFAIEASEAIVATVSAEDTLDEMASALGSTAWQVAVAQETERQRMAREVHDGPAQALANAIFELEFCERLLEKDPVKLRQELGRLKDDLRQGLADLRHFIFGLRPAVLSELGLAATLARYAEGYQSRCGIAVTLEVGEGLQLDSTQEVAIFRIVQEALQNTRKHSKASKVVIRLQPEPDRLVVNVEDNGEGFDLAETGKHSTGHFGLRGMEERARLIGAELTIESNRRSGTKVILLVPREQREECC